MIFQCIQKERLPLTKHEFTRNDVIIGSAETPRMGFSKMKFGENIFTLQVQGLKKVSILQDNAEVGSICPQLCVTKKILFMPIGYEYHELNLNGDTVTVYESGLGAGKHFYSIYRDGKVIAVIHKPDLVVALLDKYTCYVEKYEDAVLAAIYCMFLESLAYYHRATADEPTVDGTATVTTQKELKEKYDPSFIERIIEQERNSQG
jgi:hypothetical protein